MLNLPSLWPLLTSPGKHGLVLSSGITDQDLNSTSATCKPCDSWRLTSLAQTSVFSSITWREQQPSPSLVIREWTRQCWHIATACYFLFWDQNTDPFQTVICAYVLRSPEIKTIKSVTARIQIPVPGKTDRCQELTSAPWNFAFLWGVRGKG